jgi:MSHA biogenesis protein MshN
MSIINQMLRDLDARGATSADRLVPPAARQQPVKRRAAARTTAILGLLAVSTAVLYRVWPNAPREAPPADTAPARQQAGPATVAIAPAAGYASQPRPEQATVVVPPVVVQRAGPTRVAVRGEQNLPQPPRPPSLMTPASPAQVEPAVVKNLAEVSPEAGAQLHYDDAQALRRVGKFDEAIAKYRQALDRNPGMTNARIQFAKLLQEVGKVDEAMALLKVGYEQRADDALAIAVGRLSSDLGQRDEALAWLTRAQAGLRPADHALMGALLSQENRHEDASLAYQRALAAEPDQGGWLLGLGLALEAQGRVDEARMTYRNALEHGQFKPEVMRFLRERSGFSVP